MCLLLFKSLVFGFVLEGFKLVERGPDLSLEKILNFRSSLCCDEYNVVSVLPSVSMCSRVLF